MSDEQTIEERASAMGWSPQENFKGDPERWVDAETYVKRGEEFIPFLQADKRKLTQDVEALRGKLTQMEQTLKASSETIEALREYNTKENKKAVVEQRKEIVEQLKEARTEGDIETEIELQTRLSETDAALKAADEKPTTKAEPAAVDYTKTPEWQSFIQDNSWFQTDMRRRALAMSLGQSMAEEGKLTGLTAAQRYALVAKETLAIMPMDSHRNGADKVEGSRGGAGEGGGSSGGKTFADLPAEAKAACDRYAGKVVGEGRAYKTTKEWRAKYVADFLA